MSKADSKRAKVTGTPEPETKILTPQEEAKAEKRRLKKLRKAEKKEAKRKKKEAKKNSFVLYDPAKMQGFSFSLPIGYFLRFFAIGFSLFGVLWLFCDAFVLTEVKALPLLIYCVAMVSAFSMIFIGKWYTLAGFGLLGAWVGLFFWQAGNPLTFYVSGIEAVFSAMMYRLTEAGFAASASISLPYFGGLSFGAFGLTESDLLIYGGVFAVATVFALIFAAFSAKRTRLLPMVILGGSLCAVCFTYNLCETNWGIACVLAGLCSTAVLSAYDKIYKEHKHSRKSRAYSGYSAALAGILALIIAAMPAATITQQWGEIEFIAGPMKKARTYITTILTGGNPEFNKMNSLNERHSNKLEDVEFKDVVLFDVKVPTKHTVYLRSWIGGEYDYETDEWVAMSSTQYSQMMKDLTSESRSFMGDQVTFDLYSLMSPTLSDGTFKEKGYEVNQRFGYAAAFVDIEYVNNSGQLFVLPSAYATPLGLYMHGSRENYYDESWSVNSDGMIASGWFNLKKSYTAAAVMPSYYSASYGLQAEREAKYYQLLCQYINELQRNSVNDTAKAVTDFRTLLNSEGLTEFSTDALKNYLSLNRNDRARWYNRYVKLVREYSEYVKEHYASYPAESKAIQQVLERLQPEIDRAATTHDKIMVVVDYLAEHYAYTYTPTKPEDPESSALDAFLTETKDGYCVQFATAATLLLRGAGLPARYVQGYVTGDLYSGKDEDGNLVYSSSVKDRNAHAWVEVYIDGLGWRTYEATSVYYDKLYYVAEEEDPAPPDITTSVTTRPPLSTDVTTSVTTTVTTAPDETTADPETPEIAKEIDPMQILRIAVGFALVLLIALLFIWQYRRARKVVDGRAYYIERSMYGSFEEKADFDQVAGVLCDSILEIHAIIGNRPLVGELPSEFAARIDKPLYEGKRRLIRQRARLAMLPYTFSQTMVLMQKHEFGRALNRSELEALGTYLKELLDSEYRYLPIYKKIWYRYVRFMI